MSRKSVRLLRSGDGPPTSKARACQKGTPPPCCSSWVFITDNLRRCDRQVKRKHAVVMGDNLAERCCLKVGRVFWVFGRPLEKQSLCQNETNMKGLRREPTFERPVIFGVPSKFGAPFAAPETTAGSERFRLRGLQRHREGARYRRLPAGGVLQHRPREVGGV